MPNQHRTVSDWAARLEAVTQHARWLNLGSEAVSKEVEWSAS